MRLVGFSLADGPARPGLLAGDEVVDLSHPATRLPATMVGLLALGEGWLVPLRGDRWRRPAIPVAEVRRHAPVPDPARHPRHRHELPGPRRRDGPGAARWQYWFNKQRTAIAGPGDPIVLLVSHMVDYEGELAMVDRAPLSGTCPRPGARDGGGLHGDQRRQRARLAVASPTFTVGKSFDTHAPCGPEMVDRRRAGRTRALRHPHLGQRRAAPGLATADLIFGCAEMIEYLTTAFPLEPGDDHRHGDSRRRRSRDGPHRSSPHGDNVRIAIEGIGELWEPVVQGGPAEP